MDEIIDVNTLFGPLPIASSDLAVDALLALMQKRSVRAACTLSTLGMLLDSTVGNAATRAACTEHPELIPVATLNPNSYFGDTATLTRLKEDGFRLVRFFPETQNWPIAFAPFRAIVNGLQSTGLPLMIDVTKAGEITALQQIVGNYTAAVVLANVSAELLAEAVAVLRECPNWRIETSNLLAPGVVKAVVDALGPERLLFGTSAPFRPISSGFNTLRFAGVSDDIRRQILAANARQTLKIAA